METETYEGWKNRATWNAWLWLNNDYGTYQGMQEYLRDCIKQGQTASYNRLISYLGLDGDRTGDGFAWASKNISRAELNAALQDEIQEIKQHQSI